MTGIDLYPPPQSYVPPNCDLEVDNAALPWTFSKKFDFVHLRLMIGNFSDADWDVVYKQAYEYVLPSWHVAVSMSSTKIG